MLREAAVGGARVEMLDGSDPRALDQADPFPPAVVVDPPAQSLMMRQEVFGPVLPVLTYDTLDGIASLLDRIERPLALYFLGGSRADKDWILRNTWAGGVSFDDVMLHPFMQDLPFGGVGESGMGRYLGHEGFRTFSNAKAVAQRPWIDVTRFLAPPFKPAVARLMRRAIR
jgi:coniferyl-aldehyde dehydrogenase